MSQREESLRLCLWNKISHYRWSTDTWGEFWSMFPSGQARERHSWQRNNICGLYKRIWTLHILLCDYMRGKVIDYAGKQDRNYLMQNTWFQLYLVDQCSPYDTGFWELPGEPAKNLRFLGLLNENFSSGAQKLLFKHLGWVWYRTLRITAINIGDPQRNLNERRRVRVAALLETLQ